MNVTTDLIAAALLAAREAKPWNERMLDVRPYTSIALLF